MLANGLLKQTDRPFSVLTVLPLACFLISIFRFSVFLSRPVTFEFSLDFYVINESLLTCSKPVTLNFSAAFSTLIWLPSVSFNPNDGVLIGLNTFFSTVGSTRFVNCGVSNSMATPPKVGLRSGEAAVSTSYVGL